MQLNVPVDIADAIQVGLNAMGVNACAEPLPRSLATELPLTLVQPIGGGGRSDVVVDQFAVRLYTWADSDEAAIDESRHALAHLLLLEGQRVGGAQVYHVRPSAMPYPAPDPEHQDLPRACFTASVWARAETTEI